MKILLNQLFQDFIPCTISTHPTHSFYVMLFALAISDGFIGVGCVRRGGGGGAAHLQGCKGGGAKNQIHPILLRNARQQ